MLTKEAFNALLKTLEEPPSHVIFMFATTEIHRVPATGLPDGRTAVQSGCQTAQRNAGRDSRLATKARPDNDLCNPRSDRGHDYG